jgi:hypothetical protein
MILLARNTQRALHPESELDGLYVYLNRRTNHPRDGGTATQ